jgi:hypothetical protein
VGQDAEESIEGRKTEGRKIAGRENEELGGINGVFGAGQKNKNKKYEVKLEDAMNMEDKEKLKGNVKIEKNTHVFVRTPYA